MVYAVDIEERRRAVPAWRGLFYADDVARWLSVTDAQMRGEVVDLGPRTVLDWGRRGFFGLEETGFQYARHPEFIRFGGVITSRAIALLLSHGVSIGRILEAHDYLLDATGLDFPFASRRFWNESDGFSTEVCSELDALVVTANGHGQIPFTELMYGRIGDPGDMEFGGPDGEFATKWEPTPGIVIDPEMQSGSPCIKGTRTPTYVLYGGYVHGEDVESLAYWYLLDEDQVAPAIDWGRRLAAVELA